MSVITLATENTTLVLNGYVFQHLTAGEYVSIEPPNESTWRANSARGGVTVGKRADGSVRDVTIRVQKYSPDDAQMNAWLNSDQVVLLDGSATQSYYRDGEFFSESYTLEGGSITGQPTDARSNTDAGEQMMEYTVQFRTAKRSL